MNMLQYSPIYATLTHSSVILLLEFNSTVTLLQYGRYEQREIKEEFRTGDFFE